MVPADFLPLVNDLVPDQGEDVITPEVRERAIEEALVRYNADLAPDPVDNVPRAHQLPVAQYAAYLLCQQLATRYSSDRDSTIAGDMARVESRARSYAARAKEYRTAYYAGTDQADPFSEQAGSGLTPAASVTSWPSRNPRFNLVRPHD
ncbi:hypothetical protein [Ottowia sp. VDI28]|uniref:hypothetical protein n=1 Tax=Ottowia sp. VDI28 TaxID=3133968 RepID=UPI003C2C71CF